MGGSLFFLLLVMSAVIYRSTRPTEGPPIADYPVPGTALLIVDIQEDYTGPQAKKPYRDGDRIVTVSNALLAQAQARGVLVIYIRNVIDNPIVSLFTGGINSPGAPGTEMDRRLLKVPRAVTVSKNRPDAFSAPELDSLLRKHHVNRLLLTGLDAAYCLDATARGALNRGYKVTLFRDGIATESGKSMEKLCRKWGEAGAQVKTGAEM